MNNHLELLKANTPMIDLRSPIEFAKGSFPKSLNLPIIENDELFPNKTNVELVEVINKSKVKMRVWERGVGITLACGSGACASVYAGQLKNLLDSRVEVMLERGSLFINIENKEAILTGPAEISFYGSIEI